MSDRSDETDGPREDAPNPTQQAIDEEGGTDKPVDVGGWEEGADTPHDGEAQADHVA